MPKSYFLTVFACACQIASFGNDAVLCKPDTLTNQVLQSLQEQNLRQYVLFPYRKWRVCVDDPKDNIKKTVINIASWESKVTAVICECISEGDVVMDIGAHIGLHTLNMSSAVGSDGIVLAFEPQSKIYNELEANLKLNNINNVIPQQIAISDVTQILKMEYVQNNEGGARVSSLASGERVQCQPIDEIFSRDSLSFIKIDAEGHEYNVLIGGEKTINKFRPIILLEVWPDGHAIGRGVGPQRNKVFNLLRSWGYRIKGINGADFLALPQEKIERMSISHIVE